MPSRDPAEAATWVARTHYGRLLAVLARSTGDLALAEDALGEALASALASWPARGVPDNPAGWLLTAARRRLIDEARRVRVRRRDAEKVARMLEELREPSEKGAFVDDRLRLLFVCTHPAIDPLAQVPLMLQTVLGLDAGAIASALRVTSKTMGQRLWRAKVKIRDAGISFREPEEAELPARVHAVLEAIYAAYGTAWEAPGMPSELATEALYLARLVVELLPGEAEAWGLLALLLFVEARRDARRDAEGAYVPLPEQSPGRWSAAQIEEAEAALRRAFALGRLGPLQLEAAIQAAHVDGRRCGEADTRALLDLYEGLLALAPSVGAAVARASVLLSHRGPAEALAALEAIEAARDYQPWWAVKAAAHAEAGEEDEAMRAYAEAIARCDEPAVRTFLEGRRDAVRLRS